jgi:hypothetical protein
VPLRLALVAAVAAAAPLVAADPPPDAKAVAAAAVKAAGGEEKLLKLFRIKESAQRQRRPGEEGQRPRGRCSNRRRTGGSASGSG